MKKLQTLTHEEMARVLNLPTSEIKAFLRGIPTEHGRRIAQVLSPLCPRPVHDPDSDEEKRDPAG